MQIMTHWIRFEADGVERFGTLSGAEIAEHEGNMFAGPIATGRRFVLGAVRLLMPCKPTKMVGLWNNFHERARVEGLTQPAHPLYFLKANNSFSGPGERIPRPAGYDGQVVFEGELGIVIGKRCAGKVPPDAVFGYTCVNDVTARDILRADPSFPQWTRAKGFDGFGVFGPSIATGLEPETLRVRTVLAGELKQDYPVADMFFSPAEVVARLAQDMTLEPGDVIACGTSVGVCAIRDGDSVEVVIDGVGSLTNVFG
jgi:2-keto-4-pentenoate hydratase/2-oxohepta-3-ene-1,7-dioic acid hydratase in catechol pathway